MSKVYVGSAEELIVGLTALCGELPLKDLADMQSYYSRFYFQNSISLACREKYVRKVKSLGGEYLRLSLPKGDALVMGLSDVLYENFLLMAEADIKNPRTRYKGDAKRKARRQAFGRATSFFWELDFVINGISFETGSRPPADMMQPLNLVSSGSILGEGNQVESLIARLPSDSFLTCHRLREEGSAHSKEESSRKYGLLKTQDRFFLVYYLTSIGYTWTKDIEKYNWFRYKVLTGNDVRSIFLYDDMEIFDNIINPVRISKSMCQPLSVFNDAYLIKTDEKGRAILKILKIKDGEEKLLRLIFPDVQACIAFDGMLDGAGIFNFLTCNISKIKKAKEKIAEGKDIFLVICEYQKEMVLRALKKYQHPEERLIVISDDAFIAFIDMLMTEEKNADIQDIN